MSRARGVVLFPAGCLCFAILLGLPGAIYAPDAGQYRLLALGQRSAVPAPFSARILGPAAAGWKDASASSPGLAARSARLWAPPRKEEFRKEDQ